MSDDKNADPSPEVVEVVTCLMINSSHRMTTLLSYMKTGWCFGLDSECPVRWWGGVELDTCGDVKGLTWVFGRMRGTLPLA